MNARELRIGNLVIWNGDPEESGLICPIDGEDIDKMERSEAYSKEHSPIQLTEEWLIKFGFEKDQFYFMKHPLNIGLFQNEIDVNYCDSEDEGGEFQLFDVNLKYVHQLQNLYFALTGEELTMK